MGKSKVYLSSTFRDLEEHREFVVDKINRELRDSFELCQVMECMYDDGRNRLIIDDCLNEVRKSDIYFLIVGNRVGTKVPSRDKTYTEMEYETAMAEEKRIFRFLKTDFNEAECDDVEKYKAFKSQLNGHYIQEFKDYNSFEKVFLTCLSVLLMDHAVKTGNSRSFYYVLAVLIGAIMIICTLLTYRYTRGQSEGLLLTSLVPLLFGCIILFTLKDILFPTTVSNYKLGKI